MISIFQCKDNRKKKLRVTFDGGSTGTYVVCVCEKCSELDNFEFVIKEELI